MSRIARIVVPGIPHHVTQRGNRRQQTFFGEDDYQAYLNILAYWCREFDLDIWAYCLMPNHVHLIAVPKQADSLALSLGTAHGRYTSLINTREGWKGHLWQGRFASFPMDEAHLLTAARYVELNPVRAGLVSKASEWRWSSARAHLSGRDDRLVRVAALGNLIPDWPSYIGMAGDDRAWDSLRERKRTGRPLGSEAFVGQLEQQVGRVLKKNKRGPKPKGSKG